ncbi:hypothetical protein B0H14DRAFT_3145516 [Mycena olivaceomarginata]|nr:hypothetical protein B0H14DRAFT_3145516 [Mycena olivaceomarginata]
MVHALCAPAHARTQSLGLRWCAKIPTIVGEAATCAQRPIRTDAVPIGMSKAAACAQRPVTAARQFARGTRQPVTTAQQALCDADNNGPGGGLRVDAATAMVVTAGRCAPAHGRTQSLRWWYVPSGPGAYSTGATLAWGARRLRGRIHVRFAPGTQYAPLSIRASGHTHKKHPPPPGGAGSGELHAGTHYRSPPTSDQFLEGGRELLSCRPQMLP